MAALTYRLSQGHEDVRVFALWFAAVCVVIAGFVLLAALVWSSLTCDESCYGPGWDNSPDAWQWKALPVLAAAGFTGVAAAAFLLLVSSYRASLRALAAGAVPYVALTALLFSGS